MKSFIILLAILTPEFALTQEVNFFTEISCEPIKKEFGHSLNVSFLKSVAYFKIFEFEKAKKNKSEKVDLFPAKSLEAHVFLSRNFCQFHVISRRPSVDAFHFVMNVDNLKSIDSHFYEGPAHFNFRIDDISPMAKEHKLVTCQIQNLKIPGYYFHSCKKKKEIKKIIKENSTRTEPKYEYYEENSNTNNPGGSSSSK